MPTGQDSVVARETGFETSINTLMLLTHLFLNSLYVALDESIHHMLDNSIVT